MPILNDNQDVGHIALAMKDYNSASSYTETLSALEDHPKQIDRANTAV